jgi:formylglycine-generating enzyme required for sulfatase activity
MRKWIPLFILVFGFLLLTCTSCTPKSSSTSTSCTPTNTDGAETIFIDGSTFMMGSLSTDVGAESDEQPQHEVNLGCYNIYKKEVTNAMYAKCVASGSCFPVQPRENTPTAHVNDPLFSEYPVVGVDYNMATEYCSWAGARLTTEAEWEYASRGNKLFTYPWGNNDPTCSLANSKGCFNPDDTEKVGSLTAGNSPVKVMDVAGNAWEWVFDWYGANYYQNSPSNNPTGPINGFWKVVRGGGYNSIPSFLRTANRHAGDPYEAYYNVGFRCATGAFTLTEGYQQPNQDLHRIPINGPVDDGDPNNPGNPSLNTGILPIGCPDGNGNLHIFLEVSSPDTPQMGSFYLNGEVFGCNWDAGNHWYECVGQAPQTNDPTYSVTYCFHVGDGDQCMLNVQVPKPQNCDGSQTPTVQNIQVSCPNEGNIKVVFHSEPAVTWDLAQIDGGVDMDCNYLDPLDYQCTAPDILTNGK